MYGLIGKMVAAENQRDTLIEIILGGVDSMPGCPSYVVAKDVANSDVIWITEVWDSKASHEASLSLPAVQASIQKAMALIAEFEETIETKPVGGTALPKNVAIEESTEREAARRLAQMGEPSLTWINRRGGALKLSDPRRNLALSRSHSGQRGWSARQCPGKFAKTVLTHVSACARPCPGAGYRDTHQATSWPASPPPRPSVPR